MEDKLTKDGVPEWKTPRLVRWALTEVPTPRTGSIGIGKGSIEEVTLELDHNGRIGF